MDWPARPDLIGIPADFLGSTLHVVGNHPTSFWINGPLGPLAQLLPDFFRSFLATFSTSRFLDAFFHKVRAAPISHPLLGSEMDFCFSYTLKILGWLALSRSRTPSASEPMLGITWRFRPMDRCTILMAPALLPPSTARAIYVVLDFAIVYDGIYNHHSATVSKENLRN